MTTYANNIAEVLWSDQNALDAFKLAVEVIDTAAGRRLPGIPSRPKLSPTLSKRQRRRRLKCSPLRRIDRWIEALISTWFRSCDAEIAAASSALAIKP